MSNIWTRDSDIFGYGSSREVISNRLSTNKEARLIIFAPMQMQATIVRPINYYFNDDFMEKVCENIAYQSKNVSGGHRNHLRPNGYLYGYDTDHNIALPSDTYHECDRGVVNGLFRFLLIIDNAPSGRHNYFRDSQRNRVVYSGWCTDEPVSPRGIINYECEFIFTHMNQINLIERSSPSTGYSTEMYVANAKDIISSRLAELDDEIYGDRCHVTTPSYVVDSVDRLEDNIWHHYNDRYHGSEENSYYGDPDRYYPGHDEPAYIDVRHHNEYDKDINYEDDLSNILAPDENTIDRLNNVVYNSTIYNSPRQGLNRVLCCMAEILNDSDGMIGEGEIYPGMGDPSIIATKMRHILNDQPTQSVIGPDFNKTNTFGTLISMYPNLHHNTTVINITSDCMYYDILDETRCPNMYAIAVSYIKTSIPAILEEYAIARFRIRYASTDPRQSFISHNQRDYVVQVETAEPMLINEPKDVFAKRVKTVTDAIIENVFQIVENFAGDIEVVVDSSVGFETIVQLQLCEQDTTIVNDSCLYHGDLNGLLTPYISDRTNQIQHKSAMASLIKVIKQEKIGQF